MWLNPGQLHAGRGCVLIRRARWGLLRPFLSPADKNADLVADPQAATLDHKEGADAEVRRATRGRTPGPWYVMHTPAYLQASLRGNKNKPRSSLSQLFLGFLLNSWEASAWVISWPLLPSGVPACGPSPCSLCSSYNAGVESVSPIHRALPWPRNFVLLSSLSGAPCFSSHL